VLNIEMHLHPLEEGGDVADLVLHRRQPLLLTSLVLWSKEVVRLGRQTC
jgi:hypothetical protein